MEAYEEYVEAARATMKAGATAHDVHTAVSKAFTDRGFKLGHVTGHSIGMTMIEFPRVGEGLDVELRENMVISMHPHAITEDERTCLYMQDTWLVTPEGGEPFSSGADPDLPTGGGAVSANVDVFLEAIPPALAGRVLRPRGGARIPGRVVPRDHLRRRIRAATAAAGSTSRLALATGVVGIWSRSPVTMALQAATLNELSGGRLLLGVGPQASGYVAGWHGRSTSGRSARCASTSPSCAAS